MVLKLDNDKYIDILILKNDIGIYEYYNDGILIGVYDPEKMGDNKFLEVNLERINTLENEISGESKDSSLKQIIEAVKEKMNAVELDDIEKEAKENQVIMEYLEENGIDKEKINQLNLEI